MSQIAKYFKLTGYYDFFGKKEKVELQDLTFEDGILSGQGGDSRGFYKLSGGYKDIVNLKLEYINKHTLIFEGKNNEKNHSEGTWKIENSCTGKFSLDLKEMEVIDTTKKEIPKKEEKNFINGKRMNITVEIVTPEKALVKMDVRLDQTIGSLKQQIMKMPKFFNFDDAMSTKAFKSDNKKFNTKIGSISGSHPTIRFELCPLLNDSHKGYLKNSIPKQYSTSKPNLHHKHQDGAAFDNERTLEYYAIQHGTTFYMHLEYYIEVVCFQMENKLETNGFLIARVPKDPVYPRFHIKVFPTDTVANVKRHINDYQRNSVRKAYSVSDASLQHKETSLQIDLDKIKCEKWILVKDGTYTPLVEARPMEYYLVKGFCRFEMKQQECGKLQNGAHVTNVDGHLTLKDFVNTTKEKEDKTKCKNMKQTQDEFPICIKLKVGDQKDIKVRPSMKINQVKELIVKQLKAQKAINITPGDFYIRSLDKICCESQTCTAMKLRKFSEIFIICLDGEIM